MDLALENHLQEPWQWGKKQGTRHTMTTAQQVANCLHAAQQDNQRLALSQEEAGLLENPGWLDLSKLKGVRKYPAEDFIITVETGITMGELLEQTQTQGQTFPLNYPEETMLSDILAADRPSLETGFWGYPRDYVLKTEVATPDGVLAYAGADVVKNVTGYDLNKLYVGGHHALGVITAVTLKLYPLTSSKRSWLLKAESLEQVKSLTQKLLTSTLPLSLCEISHEPEQYDGWQVVIQVKGDALFIDEAQTVLNGLLSMDTKPLKPMEEKKVYKSLQQWARKSMVIEAALPLNRWQDFLKPLTDLMPELNLQVRPAAGLVYLILDSTHAEFSQQLGEVNRQALQREGFIECVHAPVSLWENLAGYNLPADPLTQILMKKLKSGYDPKGVLFTPRLPLTPIG